MNSILVNKGRNALLMGEKEGAIFLLAPIDFVRKKVYNT